MIEPVENLLSIKELLQEEIPFAIYRAPGDNKIHIIAQSNSNLYTTTDIEELNGKVGFVIAPFQCNKETPLCLIQPDRYHTIEISDKELSNIKHNEIVSSIYTDDYRIRFKTFSDALQNNRFEKLVLSRKQTIDKYEIDIEKSFLDACSRYKHSYVYLFYTPITGVWMGSTPEILLSNVSGKWQTVALAGTQSLKNGELPEKWDVKNQKEQALVSSYIRDLLKEYDANVEETSPYSVKAGELSHIRTDFYFSLANTNKLGSLLKSLHPTPAVCGMPKKEAYHFINDNEGYSRKYYSGFIGVIDPNNTTNLFVHLRCIHFEESGYTLYAGGGLLASSNLQDEWVETEKKMHTMKNILVAK